MIEKFYFIKNLCLRVLWDVFYGYIKEGDSDKYIIILWVFNVVIKKISNLCMKVLGKYVFNIVCVNIYFVIRVLNGKLGLEFLDFYICR